MFTILIKAYCVNVVVDIKPIYLNKCYLFQNKIYYLGKIYFCFAIIKLLKHTIKKEALAQMFSCEFCEISKNSFFTEHFRVTTSKQVTEMRVCNRMTYIFKDHIKIVKIYMVKFNVSILNRLKTIFFVNTKYIHKCNVSLNKTVTKLCIILTKCFFSYLNPTSYLKQDFWGLFVHVTTH